MGWDKPRADLVAWFDAHLPQADEVERRRMFGCPCAFVRGNMFGGIHEATLILRLPAARRERLLAAGDARAFTTNGRTMREYVVLEMPVGQDRSAPAALLAEACAFAASLPAKKRASR